MSALVGALPLRHADETVDRRDEPGHGDPFLTTKGHNLKGFWVINRSTKIAAWTP
jgi:hypothetical protein